MGMQVMGPCRVSLRWATRKSVARRRTGRIVERGAEGEEGQEGEEGEEGAEGQEREEEATRRHVVGWPDRSIQEIRCAVGNENVLGI